MTAIARGEQLLGTTQAETRSHVPVGSILLTNVTEWEDGQAHAHQDALAAEEPLEIRMAGRPLVVTMRTPGHDCELAAGFLLTEGLIDGADEIVALRQGAARAGKPPNVVHVEIRRRPGESKGFERTFAATSACGICGKASIEAIRSRGLLSPNAEFAIEPEVLCLLPEKLRAEQQVFRRTGGLHAAALFDGNGNLEVLREDIGRHNAVDKIVGWALLRGMIPLSRHVLLVSGRGGFEIAQKALAAGVPVLASFSAPSSLAVRLAREFNLTLIGFLRRQRFVVYAGESRCPGPAKTPSAPLRSPVSPAA